mmetsp:Transcript_16627/g.42966  ORF Transcript_16627/g.42966 Transcript_16627/m.42966 type:complete len:274 (+) Transcript_16627:78-899(+)
MARRRSAPAAGVAAALLASAAVPSRGFVRELYTTNAVCMQKYCVNPVFPALEQLPAMESKRWAKHSLANVSQFMSFCGQVVDYDLAAPMAQSLNATGLSARARAERVQEEVAKGNVVLDYEARGLSDPMTDAIVQMDRAAARSYFLHLGGMGIEAWDHQDPMQESAHPLRACAKSVAKMACYTYFPKAHSVLQDGQEVAYRRPCRSSCQSYLQACGVQCCDEGVSCVWGGTTDNEAVAATQGPVRMLGQGGREVFLQVGYVDAAGPSTTCTGD